MPKLVLLAILFVCVAPAAAQPVPDSTAPGRSDPALGPSWIGFDDERGSEERVRRLVDLAGQPLDLNAASARELDQIPALSLLVARRIVAHRGLHGRFSSVSDLQRVEGVTAGLVGEIRPFLFVVRHADGANTPPTASQRALKADILQQISRRLDLGRGYSDDTTRTTFLGSPERWVTRIRARVGTRVEAGLTLDKDPGEAFGWRPSQGLYGVDHVSATLALQKVGGLDRLVVGDYAVALGQGLVVGRSSAFGKGRDPVGPLLRSSPGIVSRASTEENRFFRGLAAAVTPFASLSSSAWVSRKRRDASDAALSSTAVLRSTDESSPQPIRGFSSGGYHRTPAELARKNAVAETHVGGALSWKRPSWQLGGTLLHTRLDRPLAPDRTGADRFDAAGDRFTAASLFGDVSHGALHVFGEVARSASGSWAGVGGVSTSRRSVETLLFGRWYPRDFWSLHGQALGETRGAPQNEEGVYAGVRLQVASQWEVAGYVDVYRFPWMRHGVPRPSSGTDARLVVEHTPRPWLQHRLQVRAETRGVGTGVDPGQGRVVDGVHPATRQSLRWSGTYSYSRAVRLRTRLEGVRSVDAPPRIGATTSSSSGTAASPPVRYGMLLYQDLRWSPTSWLTIDGRLSLFDTDDYATRVFAYESDLLYSFTVPALQGRGQRSYLFARLRPHPRWVVEAKVAETRYRGVDTVGSGLQETPGTRLREVKLQLRWQLR